MHQTVEKMSMSRIRMCWFLSTLLLVASASAAFGQVVYQWKDATGNMHYTDTPPPAGATLLKGPKPAAAAGPAGDDKSMLRMKCRPDISAGDCAAARQASQAELDDLASTSQQEQGNASETDSDVASKQQFARIRADECSQSRIVLAALQRRQNDVDVDVGERLTAEDRVAMPRLIEEADQRIAHFCD